MGYNPEYAKYAILGVAGIVGGAAIGAALKESRKHKKVEFNPWVDELPIGKTQGAMNVAFAHLGMYLGFLGIHEALRGSGYTQPQIATMAPQGFVAMGTLGLVSMAIQLRRK